MEWILVRHPPVAIPPGLCYGQTDVPLQGNVNPWVTRIKEHLPHWQSLDLMTSDLNRCRSVAEALGPAILDERLRELSFGDWEGKSWCELPREKTEWWAEDIEQRSPPSGESFSDLKSRAKSFMDELADKQTPTLCLTHAGFIRAALAQGLGLSADQVFRFDLDFGSLTKLSFGKTGWQLVFWNR